MSVTKFEILLHKFINEHNNLNFLSLKTQLLQTIFLIYLILLIKIHQCAAYEKNINILK